jgi:hypothetical protein
MKKLLKAIRTMPANVSYPLVLGLGLSIGLIIGTYFGEIMGDAKSRLEQLKSYNTEKQTQEESRLEGNGLFTLRTLIKVEENNQILKELYKKISKLEQELENKKGSK